jgi:hypothetical protein
MKKKVNINDLENIKTDWSTGDELNKHRKPESIVGDISDGPVFDWRTAEDYHDGIDLPMKEEDEPFVFSTNMKELQEVYNRAKEGGPVIRKEVTK